MADVVALVLVIANGTTVPPEGPQIPSSMALKTPVPLPVMPKLGLVATFIEKSGQMPDPVNCPDVIVPPVACPAWAPPTFGPVVPVIVSVQIVIGKPVPVMATGPEAVKFEFDGETCCADVTAGTGAIRNAPMEIKVDFAISILLIFF